MPDKNMSDLAPPGFRLLCTLRGHKKEINRITWSPDGKTLASSSGDGTVRLWDVHAGRPLHTLMGHTDWVSSVIWSPDGNVVVSGSGDKTLCFWDVQTGRRLQSIEGHAGDVNCITWSPDGKMLASGSDDKIIQVWDIQTGQSLRTLTGHSEVVGCITWSPDGKMLASGSDDTTIRFWDIQTGQPLRTLIGHSSMVVSVVWSPSGEVLASAGSYDRTIRIWDPDTGQQVAILEGHTDSVNCLSFSNNSFFLASKSQDGTVRIWRTDTWETVAILNEPASGGLLPSLAFHPHTSILATLDEDDTVIRIWDLDIPALLKAHSVAPSIHYINAKVVLVGDSGVGKSGLGLVLTNQPFIPTMSTHGRSVWSFDSTRVKLNGGREEIREILLWDMAGQPGYRLIHQLHLDEVAVALVVFDARSETDPFAGIQHWDRALRQAQIVQGDTALSIKKMLVAARTDRGGIGVSSERLQTLVQNLGFDGYFATSAKDGFQITELKEAIQKAIDWEHLPKVSSTHLFQNIKAFLVAEKESGRILSTIEDLYRLFLGLKGASAPIEIEDIHRQFVACIGRVESTGLIQRLSFGNLVLLQPEILDTYASALINAVRDEPDGLGSIPEESVRMGNFRVPESERLNDKEQEKLLLIAMTEDLLRHELVLREEAFLIFPSQSTRENANLPDPEGKSVIFAFEGPVLNIYATLAVRISYSGLFTRKELWKNAVTYTTKLGGMYGLFLNNFGEGRAELSLFFDKMAREELCFHFEEYIKMHLQRRALPNTIQRRRIFVCPTCMTSLEDLHVKRRRERGINWMTCGVCDTRVLILDEEERLSVPLPSRISEMDRAADQQRNRETAQSTVLGKQETSDFDVFLCYNRKDKSEVKAIGEQLKQQRILPWFDEWELRPGLPWQDLLEQQIGHIKSAAVFVGKDGIGPWQRQELNAFLREFVERGCPVIPVLLGDALEQPMLPIFLKGMIWVDFRLQEPDPMKRLIWGITGTRGTYR